MKTIWRRFATVMLFFMSLSPPTAWASPFNQYSGKSFSAPGPNCFSSALKMAGITRYFRGMDETEFRQITRLFCVPVSVPNAGDIGVFEKPGFGFLHAYVYVHDGLGIQKPGVDYAGKTPIAFAPIENISYTYEASPECRRYSENVSDCSNDHYYLHCQPINFGGHRFAEKLESALAALEAQQDKMLQSEDWGSSTRESLVRITHRLAREEERFRANFSLPPDLRALFSGKITSLKKQNLFLFMKFGTMNQNPKNMDVLSF